jgi:hypothetical protein
MLATKFDKCPLLYAQPNPTLSHRVAANLVRSHVHRMAILWYMQFSSVLAEVGNLFTVEASYVVHSFWVSNRLSSGTRECWHRPQRPSSAALHMLLLVTDNECSVDFASSSSSSLDANVTIINCNSRGRWIGLECVFGISDVITSE